MVRGACARLDLALRACSRFRCDRHTEALVGAYADFPNTVLDYLTVSFKLSRGRTIDVLFDSSDEESVAFAGLAPILASVPALKAW